MSVCVLCRHLNTILFDALLVKVRVSVLWLVCWLETGLYSLVIKDWSALSILNIVQFAGSKAIHKMLNIYKFLKIYSNFKEHFCQSNVFILSSIAFIFTCQKRSEALNT